MDTVLFAVLGSILILAGFVGVFAPLLPGVPLAWLGLFIYAIGTDFEKISITMTVVFFVIMLLILLIDFLTPMLGARKYQASKYGMLGAFLGTIVGIIVFGFWGIILGPLIGAFALELIVKRRTDIAIKAAFGTLVGFLAGALIKVIYILVLGGFFVASWF